MKTFEEIKDSWQQKQTAVDETLLNKISQRIKKLKNKNLITTVVLSLTMGILIAYFIWIGRVASFDFQLGLTLMIGSLFIRIILELLSTRKLSKLPASNSMIDFKNQIKIYYKSRLRLHQMITPLILIVYWIGFALLLPSLKENLTAFWYNYVWISSIPIAIIMVLFIGYHIRKEQKTLKNLTLEK